MFKKFDVRKWAAGASSMFLSVAVFAQGSGSTDPTTTIVAQITTYTADVATIAAAVLLLFYGKRLVGYLKV
jgi:hypothetical protein